jgi:Uma2 family endonuclease
MISAPIKSRPRTFQITWDLLPDDYQLPDDPVDNILQPFLAAFLNEILNLNGYFATSAIFATNFGICATVNGKTVVKAPDWVWVPNVPPLPDRRIRRSYTPQKEGETPAIVMEFLSETECGEYSMKPNYPYGKWLFYEQILQVPIYIIFDPANGNLEVYFLINEHYKIQNANPEGRYWLESIGLFIGVWDGDRLGSQEYWLRWWDAEQQMLPCGGEKVEMECQRVELERQRAEQESQRAERLAAQLRSHGIEPDV